MHDGKLYMHVCSNRDPTDGRDKAPELEFHSPPKVDKFSQECHSHHCICRRKISSNILMERMFYVIFQLYIKLEGLPDVTYIAKAETKGTITMSMPHW